MLITSQAEKQSILGLLRTNNVKPIYCIFLWQGNQSCLTASLQCVHLSTVITKKTLFLLCFIVWQYFSVLSENRI